MIDIRLLSSLEKVFLDEAPCERPLVLQALRNETVSFQVAFRQEEPGWSEVNAVVDSPLGPCVRLRQVEHVPVRFPNYDDGDADTLRWAPGLYPDLLTEARPHSLHMSRRWSCLWVDVALDGAPLEGKYPLTIRLEDAQGTLLTARTVEIEVIPALLPPQRLIHTRWFHCDGLAQYYGVEVFGEEHWRIIGNFIRAAVKRGINMILMPIHTPPLDTRVGGERLTTQLVKIAREKGKYSFDMADLRRWIQLCRDCGVEYYEAAHLYTQWGAGHAPKIMATVDGEYRRLFGWETEAVGGEYGKFLQAYIPALRRVFEEEGIAERVRWHISDEPSQQHLESYLAARRQVDEVLQGCVVMDALSNFDFYSQGVVAHPVVANDHMEPFIDAKAPGLWTYYCCAQYKSVSNMFIAMPSWRNRMIAAQLFLYDIEGLLQWGYNFYNCQYSDYPVNPYLSTDADGWVPAGDPFQVYPGEGGVPEESLRMMVTFHAMQDLRAMELLAQLTSREAVKELIQRERKITFTTAAKDGAEVLAIRERINREILLHL